MNLTFLLIVIYGLFSLFQGKTGKSKTIAGVVVMVALLCLGWSYTSMDPTINILPQIFQQFNPFFVIALTPVSLAVFGYLARKGKEPSAPRKIGIGMMIAVCGFLIMAIGSIGLPTPDALAASGIEKDALVSPNWLISTYLVLTFAELFLSPMGISFVSKVAPPKYKGMWMVVGLLQLPLVTTWLPSSVICGEACNCGWYGVYLSYAVCWPPCLSSLS